MAVVSVEITWQENRLLAFTNKAKYFAQSAARQLNASSIFPADERCQSLVFNLEVDRDGSLWIASSGLYYYKDNRCLL